MAITLGVHASAGSADGNTAATPARALTTGSAVMAVVSWGSTTAGDATLSDNAGNTWVKVGTSLGPTTGGTGGYNCRGVIYKCENCTGHASFVLTATRSGEYPSVAYQEYKGTGITVEAFAQANDSVTPFSSGSAGTPAANGAGLFGAWVHNAASGGPTLGVNSPMTVVEAVTNVSIYYPVAMAAALQTTAAAFSADFTSTDSVGATAVFGAFLKEASGGGSTVIESTGSSAGTSTATGESKAIDSTVGASAGVATAAAIGATVKGAIGTSGPSGATPVLGIHNLTWGYHGDATDPTNTPSLTTTPGSTLLVLVANFTENDAAPTDNKGNTFTRVGSRQTYALWPDNGVSAWVSHNIAGGSGHVISVQQDGQPDGEVTVFTAEIVNGGVIQAVSQTEVLGPTDLVSGTVTATQDAVLLGFWWGDNGSGPHTAAPRDGFTVLDSLLDLGSLIQGVMAYKAVTAGTYSVGWDETPSQGALLPLFAVQSSGSGGPTAVGVSQTLFAGTGASSGVAAASAVSGSIAASVGASAGAADVSGVGDDAASDSTIIESTGSASGGSSASATAAAVVASTGASQGQGAAVGVSPASDIPNRSAWRQAPRTQSRPVTNPGIRNGTPTHRRPS